MRDQPLPSVVIAEEDRHLAEKLYFVEPLQPISVHSPDQAKGPATVPWAPNLTARYQHKFFNG